MGTIASQITSLTTVYSTVYSDADQRKHQISASLAFVWGLHRGLVNSPHKWPATRKMLPFDDVIMAIANAVEILQYCTKLAINPVLFRLYCRHPPSPINPGLQSSGNPIASHGMSPDRASWQITSSVLSGFNQIRILSCIEFFCKSQINKDVIDKMWRYTFVYSVWMFPPNVSNVWKNAAYGLCICLNKLLLVTVNPLSIHFSFWVCVQHFDNLYLYCKFVYIFGKRLVFSTAVQ